MRDLTVRVFYGHNPEADYHEWYVYCRVAVDATLRRNGNMVSGSNATEWRCNNNDCSAKAIVHDDHMLNVLPIPPAPRLTAIEAMDEIAKILSGAEWDDETLMYVAGVVAQSGREIKDVNP